jgi:predicted Zn-ribbon and HTH transcriptional regulator
MRVVYPRRSGKVYKLSCSKYGCDFMKVNLTISGWKCERCGYEWVQRKRIDPPTPRFCPKCRSIYWDRPRKVKTEKVAVE